MARLVVKGKTVGNLVGTTLVKTGKQVVKFHIYDGFGVAQHLILDPRVEKIRLHYGNKIYKASVGDFINHGIAYHKPLYEPQFILPIKFFTVMDAQQLTIEGVQT